MGLHVIILAAGQGTRMKSSLPKVLHPIAGKPMLHHVIDNALALDAEGIHVVVGHGAELVKHSISNPKLDWALQAEQKGTGHAVSQALPNVPDDANVLVLYGDVPLTKLETLSDLVARLSSESMSLLTCLLDEPSGYGRIIRNEYNNVTAIVEQKDATTEQLRVKEVNTGILAAKAAHLKTWLPALSNDNAQGEYYLTDIIEMAVGEGVQVEVAQPGAPEEVQGVNNRIQLSELERWYQSRFAIELMTNGVTLMDPARVDLRGQLEHGSDVTVDVNVIFEGKVKIGNNVKIGANCSIKNSEIGDGVVIAPNTVIEDAKVGTNSNVGPFARLRPGTELAENAKVGNFVETKKTFVGEGSKINHLSYVGDAVLGAGVNVGAGTITCNYDGVNKFKTELGDGVFVGSNSSLVAPVSVGKDATIGAGSVITSNVNEDQLAVARGKQRNIDGWKKPSKK